MNFSILSKYSNFAPSSDEDVGLKASSFGTFNSAVVPFNTEATYVQAMLPLNLIERMMWNGGALIRDDE